MGGFVPNSLFTMGHRPEILQAFLMLAGTINGPGTVDPGLKQLVAYVASNAAGCRYCQAHTSAHAAHAGVAGREDRARLRVRDPSDLLATPSAPRCAWRATRRWCPTWSRRRTSRRCAGTSTSRRSSSWSRCARCSASSTAGTTPCRPSSKACRAPSPSSTSARRAGRSASIAERVAGARRGRAPADAQRGRSAATIRHSPRTSGRNGRRSGSRICTPAGAPNSMRWKPTGSSGT